MSRFDYVTYDKQASILTTVAKTKVEDLERWISSAKDSRYKNLALDCLEQTYMYIGKMIRDDQIAREAAEKVAPAPVTTAPL